MQTAVGEWLRQTLGLGHEAQVKLFVSVAIIAILWLLRAGLLWVVRRRTDSVRLQYQWKKISAYLVAPLGILLIARVWVGGFEHMATYLGLLSAGVAIALRDPLVNLAAWAFILWRRPFQVGDRIQIGDSAGDVIDLRIFQFTLLEIGNWVHADQSTGRVIHIPNGLVFSQPLANYTREFDFIWNELPVLVTFESNWQKAKSILQEIVDQYSLSFSSQATEQVKRAARRFMIVYSKLTPIVYTSVADSGVLLTLRYLCHPRQRRSTAQQIWEEILRRFAACNDIDFAYPTQRFYDNLSEGKRGAATASELVVPEPRSAVAPGGKQGPGSPRPEGTQGGQ